MKQLIALLLLSITAYAQATDSATQVPDDLVQQNIQKRLEKVVEEKATASGEVLASKALAKRGWVGTIADIAQKTLTLTTAAGSRQVNLADSATLIASPGQKKLPAGDLAIGDHVIAIGFVNGNGVMDLRRLLVVTDFQPTPERQVKLITLTEDKPKLTGKTKITAGLQQQKAAAKDLTPGAKALLITVAETLVRIHLL